MKQILKKTINSSLRCIGLEVRKYRKSTSEERFVECITRALSPERNPLVIDIGAHEGQTSLSIRKISTGATILAFEPSAGAFDVLSQRAKLYNFSAFNLALGAEPGKMPLYCFTSSQCNSILQPDHECSAIEGLREQPQTRIVEVVDLDGFLSTKGLANKSIALIKVDVQGFEIPVLKGARRALSMTQSILVEVSFCRAYSSQCLVDEVCWLLRENGFALEASVGYLPAEDEDQLVSTDFFFKRRR